MSLLNEILAAKRREVQAIKQAQSRSGPYRSASHSNRRNFAAALLKGRPAVIAEIKRASPSKGLLAPDLDPAALARQYEMGGAAAISVLTDSRFFHGSLADLAAVRAAVSLPILRKDFIIDPCQVLEADRAGADAILLIMACLDETQFLELQAAARDFNLAVLVETHTAAEVKRAVALGAEIIGINNRDLDTFRVNIETTHDLLPLIPAGRIIVAESGIHGREDAARMAAAGVHAILVGEALVKSMDPSTTLRELQGERTHCS